MKKHFITSVFLLFHFLNYAQDYSIVWQQCLGVRDKKVYYNYATKIHDGYFFTIGITADEGVTNHHGDADIWVIRTDMQYNTLWERFYGGSDTDQPRKIAPITDTTFYILGSTYSDDGDVQSGVYGWNDTWVIKINGKGDILWEQTYGTPCIDHPIDLLPTPDGGFVLLSRINCIGGDVTQFSGWADVWIVKCDSEGNIEWKKTLGNEGLDNCANLLINKKGNIMMIGAVEYYGGMVTCHPHPGTQGNVWIVELDLQGNVVWQECYGGSIYEVGLNIIEVDEGYVFTASCFSTNGDVSGHHNPDNYKVNRYNKTDIWVVKIDSLGQIIWQRCLGGGGSDTAASLFQNAAGEYLVFGNTASNDGDVSGNNSYYAYYDIWLTILNADGELIYQKCFGEKGTEKIDTQQSVIQINDHQYILSAIISGNSDSKQCYENGLSRNGWFFELKDCDYFAPAIPSLPDGPEKVCTSVSAQSAYIIPVAANSHGYVWELIPEHAGTLSADSTQAIVNWDNNFKGQAGIRVFNFNDCGSSLWSDTLHITVATCVGIDEPETAAVKVYPNPASEVVVFQLQQPLHNGSIMISDITGRQVAVVPISGEKTQWKTEGIRPGMYLYKFSVKENTVFGKILIQ